MSIADMTEKSAEEYNGVGNLFDVSLAFVSECEGRFMESCSNLDREFRGMGAAIETSASAMRIGSERELRVEPMYEVKLECEKKMGELNNDCGKVRTCLTQLKRMIRALEAETVEGAISKIQSLASHAAAKLKWEENHRQISQGKCRRSKWSYETPLGRFIESTTLITNMKSVFA